MLIIRQRGSHHTEDVTDSDFSEHHCNAAQQHLSDILRVNVAVTGGRHRRHDPVDAVDPWAQRVGVDA